MAGFFARVKNFILTNIYTFILHAAFRYKVYYEDPAQKKNPPAGIYITNHNSLIDGIMMRAVFRNVELYSLITDTWYEKKWARALFLYERIIPVDRDNPGIAWLKDCRSLLKEGKSVNIFPEGHTTKDGPMDTFKPGFLLLSSMSGNAPIIPVATIGKYKWFFGERRRVLVGRPVSFDRSRFAHGSQAADDYAAEFRTLIEQMQDELRKKTKK